MSSQTFFKVTNIIFNAFNKKDYDQALVLIGEAKREFPDRLDKTAFWEACVHSIRGEPARAITALTSAMEKGVWWNPVSLTRDPDLKNIQNEGSFKQVLIECEEILEAASAHSDPSLSIYGNEESNTGIFSLHWKGSNVVDFAPYWQEENDYLLGFPQSSQLFGPNTYCWDDIEKATKEITDLYKDFTNQFKPETLIVAGASQGGRLAIELSVDGKFEDSKGFIAVIPAIQDIQRFEILLKANKGRVIKGCIIAGMSDPFFSRTMELKQLFDRYEIDCKWITIEGLGHFFPQDFPDILKKAVEFIKS